MNPAISDETNTDAIARTPQEWSCPRCTLLNPETSQQCQVCEYDRNTNFIPSRSVSMEEDLYNHNMIHHERRFLIRFEQLNPLLANNVIGTSTSIATTSFFGALIGGPIGAVIGGATAAILDGAARVHDHMLTQQNRRQARPRVLISSQRMIGSTMSIAMRTRSRYRNLIVEPILLTTTTNSSSNSMTNSENGATVEDRITDIGYWSQLAPGDLRMLQLLFLHILCDNNIREDQVLILSRDELLERVGYTSSSLVQGASMEAIEQHTELTVLEDDHAISRLKEYQRVCNICLEDLQEGDTMRMLTDCSHTFHKECIDQWLTQVATCPICKHQVPS